MRRALIVAAIAGCSPAVATAPSPPRVAKPPPAETKPAAQDAPKKPALVVVATSPSRLRMSRRDELFLVQRASSPRVFELQSDTLVRAIHRESSLAQDAAALVAYEGRLAILEGGRVDQLGSKTLIHYPKLPADVVGAATIAGHSVAWTRHAAFVLNVDGNVAVHLPASKACNHLALRAPSADGTHLWAAGAGCANDHKGALLRYRIPSLDPESFAVDDAELSVDSSHHGSGQVLFGARRGDGTEMAVVVVGLDPEKGTIGFDETGAHARSVDRVGEDARGDRWIALTTIDGRRLVRRSAGAWRDVPIEAERQPLELDDLRADATNGVWVTAHAGERWYLLHDSPLPNVALDP